MNSNIDFTRISSLVNELLIMEILKYGELDTSQIFRLIEMKGIIGLSYWNIHKILNNLLEKGVIRNMEGTYEITDLGLKTKEEYKERFNLISNMLLNESWNIHKDEMISAIDPITVESLFKGTKHIKTIPYTIKKIPNQNDNTFFLKDIPQRGGYYTFEGRGLGKGNFENYIVMFVNSKYIFFIGKVEEYDNETKSIYFDKGKVYKLRKPISENDLKNVLGDDFKFIRNKQTFSNENEIKLLKELIQKHI